jgi:hypothetical protein
VEFEKRGAEEHEALVLTGAGYSIFYHEPDSVPYPEYIRELQSFSDKVESARKVRMQVATAMQIHGDRELLVSKDKGYKLSYGTTREEWQVAQDALEAGDPAPALELGHRRAVARAEWDAERKRPHRMSLSYARPHGRQHTYGGKLVENAIQMLARQVQARALRRCVEEGLRVVIHSHDEIVVEAPLPWAERTREKLMQVMLEPQDWYTRDDPLVGRLELPLDCDARITERYTK